MSKHDQMRKIRDELFALKESPLYAYRIAEDNFPVIGEGSHDAHIMFVGEAPGKNEARTGRPFCGASGRILDELLSHIALKREDVYITNIVKDRPPENRDPRPEEIALYGPFLDKQIAIIRPKIIATLGRFAMQYVMKHFDLDFEIEPIGTIHGRVFEGRHPEGFSVHIIPLYHPAVAVYNSNTKSDLKKDFSVLKRFIE